MRGLGGGGAMGRGVSLVVAEVAGDLLARVAWRFGLGKVVPGAFGKDRGLAVARIGLGFLAPMIGKFLPLPSKLKTDMAAVNIASGILGLVAGFRAKMLTQTGLAGLGDYVTAEGLSEAEYGVLGQEYGVLGQDDDEGMLGDWVTAEGLSTGDEYEGSAFSY